MKNVIIRSLVVPAVFFISLLSSWTQGEAHAAMLIYDVTLSSNSFTFGPFENYSYAPMTFFASSTNSKDITSTGGTVLPDFGTIRFGGSGWLTGTGDASSATASFAISIAARGVTSSGSTSASLAGTRVLWTSGGPPMRLTLLDFSSATRTINLRGGICSLTASIYPASATLVMPSHGYAYQDYDISIDLAFSLTDPSISLAVSQSRLNTLDPGGSLSSNVPFQLTQNAQALVESLLVDYGDGTSLPVAFSQASSLTFSSSALHTFALGTAENVKNFQVTATAYAFTDSSSDSDRDTETTSVTLLRSPLASLSLDNILLPSGSTINVERGQMLSFDGSSAMGFIENADLMLGGDLLLSRTSAGGDADQLFQGTFVVSNITGSEDIVLQYVTSNTGDGLNSNTWSATLHVVPEPSTMTMIAPALMGLVGITLKRIRKG